MPDPDLIRVIDDAIYETVAVTAIASRVERYYAERPVSDALAQALRERDEARAVLRKVQWRGFGQSCPICDQGKRKSETHAPDCELAKAISDLPATEGER